MEDDMPNPMNLDLNLGPIDNSNDETETRSRSGSYQGETLTFDDLLDGSINRIRDAVMRRRWRRSALRQVPPEARNIALESIGVSGLQTGEGSVTAEGRTTTEATKTCDNNDGFLDDGALRKKDEEEKANVDAGSFFDCNICLDLSKDPVVTCCGHLFCWPCLYRWIHLHSDAKECPVCKGEVTMKNVTPIYGRGKSTRQLSGDDSSAKIPQRPQARRVESWRQAIQRTAFTIPMEEMIRRLNNRFDLSQVHPHDIMESPERSSSLLHRILTSRGIRREQNNVIPTDDLLDLPQISTNNLESGESPQISSLPIHRSNSNSNSNRFVNISPLTSTLGSAAIESFFRTHNPSIERNQEQPLPVDDRDSVSSIAAVIHSESQTVDNAVEIDSTVALSTLSSSSRRRNDSSRISDVDSGDSRAPRRRRLN